MQLAFWPVGMGDALALQKPDTGRAIRARAAAATRLPALRRGRREAQVCRAGWCGHGGNRRHDHAQRHRSRARLAPRNVPQLAPFFASAHAGAAFHHRVLLETRGGKLVCGAFLQRSEAASIAQMVFSSLNDTEWASLSTDEKCNAAMVAWVSSCVFGSTHHRHVPSASLTPPPPRPALTHLPHPPSLSPLHRKASRFFTATSRTQCAMVRTRSCLLTTPSARSFCAQRPLDGGAILLGATMRIAPRGAAASITNPCPAPQRRTP